MDLLSYLIAGVAGFATAVVVWRFMSGPLSRCLSSLVPSAVSTDLGVFVRFALLASGTAGAVARAGFFGLGITRGGPGAVASPAASNVLVQNALGAVFSSLSACIGVLFVLFVATIAGHVVLKGFQLLRARKDDESGKPEP